MYKLDRTVFKIQTVEEASSHGKYWKTKTPEERLCAAFYLNSVAYNFDLNNPPQFDGTSYHERKHSDGKHS